MRDKSIIRNKLKINAIIFNANKIIDLQKQYGSFKKWLNMQNHTDLKEWCQLFKKYFKFTGYEITKEFLISTGQLKGAHSKSCPIFNVIKNKQNE